MRRLILFRHARAEPKPADAGDSARALDAVGRAEAVAAGTWLAARGYGPDVVLISPSLRTLQTWESVADLLPKAALLVIDDLYDALPEEIVAAIEDVSEDARMVMVIAHNPGLQEVAVGLLSETPGSHVGLERVSAGFPTGAVAVLDMQDPNGPRLEALFTPRQATSTVAQSSKPSQGGES